MLRYQLQQLPNNKIYGELYTRTNEGALSLDVVRSNANMVKREMGRSLHQLIVPHIKHFISWRNKSIEKAGREMWPETMQALNALNDLCGSLPHYTDFDLVVRKLSEARPHVDAAMPKVKTEPWKCVDQLVRWAETIQTDGGAHYIVMD